MRHFTRYLYCLWFMIFCSPLMADMRFEEDSVQIADTEIPFLHYPAPEGIKAGAAFVWFEPHYGDYGPLAVPEALANAGYSVYQPDLFSAFFLPRAYSSLAEMDGDVIAGFIRYVKQNTETPVYLIGASRGAVAALNGLAESDHGASGLIALNPSIYAERPEPLKPVTFVESAKRCRTPVIILQPRQSTRIWWMEEVEKELSSGGAKVSSRFIEQVRDGFWQRPDLTPAEIDRKKHFHNDIIAAIRTLESL